MTKRTYRALIAIFSILALILIILNVTLALYSNKSKNGGIIQFGQQKLDVTVLEEQKMNFSVEEMQIGAVSTRTIQIVNPSSSSKCVFRLWLELKIENVVDTDYLKMEIEDSSFTKSDDEKFYYNRALESNASINNLVLQFTVSVSGQDLSKYENKHYSVKLYIESIQANKKAIEQDWQNYPISWFNNLGV